MDGHFFRGGRWVIDINDQDIMGHLFELKLSKDMQLIINYFAYFLFVDTERLGQNEFSVRHQEIKDGILAIMNKRYDTGARQISSIIEGIVKDSLFNDGCIDNSLPYSNWTGDFHEHPQPRNFFQLLEGALQDPRSRIGRVIYYPPEEEIYHTSEMIRNPLAHGTRTAAILEDYKALFFILVLLFHDIVNPHNYQFDDKYRRWIYFTQRNLRLSGEDSIMERVIEIAGMQNLDIEKVRINFSQIQ